MEVERAAEFQRRSIQSIVHETLLPGAPWEDVQEALDQEILVRLRSLHSRLTR